MTEPGSGLIVSLKKEPILLALDLVSQNSGLFSA